MASPAAKKERGAAYEAFRPILLAELERIVSSEECDIHRAFVHETANVFSSTASGFSLTDGKDDFGIDFCRIDAPVFTISQCKCPEQAYLEGEDTPKPFDNDALRELLSGIDYVLDQNNTYPASPLPLKQFKSAYQQSLHDWPKETRLQAALSLCGELTARAANEFRNQRNEMTDRGVQLLLWDWGTFEEMLMSPHVDLERMQLTFTIDDPQRQLLRRKNPVCIVRAVELIEAWDNYQWNLVDWNVRAEIRNSPTNKRIQDTLMTPAGRTHFQDYNNGLLIICKQVTYKDLHDKIVQMRLSQPQVVNGCQTLLSLVRAHLDLSEKEKEDFREKVQVQIKIVANPAPEFVERIVLSTNDQNPMSSRSLKSNTIEQKKLQESFRRFFVRYFYERKDGQFEGLLSFGEKTPSFRPRDYQMTPGKKKYRSVDNESLAREWLAFIGLSDETLRGGLHLFDNDRLYQRAFLIRPARTFWDAVQKTPANCPPVDKDDLFEEGSPSAAQYMLVHTVANVIGQRRVSFQRNKAEALERLAKKGRLRLDSSGQVTGDAVLVESLLVKDDKYFLGIVLNNMTDVLLELYALVLCLKYGPLEDSTCERLLKYPSIRPHLENPNLELQDGSRNAESRHVLDLTYEFLRFAVEQFIVKYGDVMRAQPRLKSYLAQRSTVDSLRAFVLEVNEEKVPNWAAAWCPGSGTFLEVLPSLS